MTPVDWQPGSNYISTVVNRARGGNKMAEEEDTQGNHVGDKGEEEESAWERSSSVCVP